MNEMSSIKRKLGIKGTPKPGEMISRMNAMRKLGMGQVPSKAPKTPRKPVEEPSLKIKKTIKKII